MSRGLWIVTACALAAGLWALWVLEDARRGIEITQSRGGDTPVTHLGNGSDGPVVVIAHGFAGSRQMMLGYGLTLAQAGYRVALFDFEGHGRHPVPMGGDVTRVDGTTRLLVAQTQRVVDALRTKGAPVALLGHSMATDILVRVAAQTDGIGPLVLLSAFSQEITDSVPPDMLIMAGSWEPGLAGFARDALRMVDPGADLGQTVAADGVVRRAVAVPLAEHVAILHARQGRVEARAWLDRFYGRSSAGKAPPTGWAILVLLASITLLSAPLARALPQRATPVAPMDARTFAIVTLVPAIAAPLLAAPIDTQILPVVVADYLSLHLALYGVIQLGLLAWRRGRLPPLSVLATFGLLAWALGGFGLALDRYGANFVPTVSRLWIIAALALGALPFMIADTWTVQDAPWWQRITARLAFLGSLAFAVALDFDDLFFLIMIAPVIVLFTLTFGTMGRAVASRAGPTSAGVALGLVLAWALGVSFPLVAA